MLSLFRPLSRRAVLLAATTLLAVSAAAFEAPQSESPLPEATTALADRVSVTAREFMVVSAHPLASRAGYAVLQAGGTAADAAVAVQAMLGLVEPQSSGLGGGGFAVHWDAALGELTTFDARETAPLAAGPDYWLDGDGRPVAVDTVVVSTQHAPDISEGTLREAVIEQIIKPVLPPEWLND
ncbi:MAG TPA: gamma-glutamyltransferase, partial [Aquamicrobium sp.]|nr:gamma-glutamyltransferase [Aquamicrobium sp.]